MFAVLKTGGKQYRVQQGDVLRVEKLQAEAGDTIQFNEVLVVGDQIGAPLVAGAAVQATVIDQIKGEKVIHFVRRRRKHSSKRTKGHRQQLTLVRVTDILASGGEETGVKAAIGSGSKASFAGMAPVAATEPAAVPKARRGKVVGLAAAAVGVAAVAAGAVLATSALTGDDQA
jgi:large subunit ribosomal protein L21